jgi:hypothetical protein
MRVVGGSGVGRGMGRGRFERDLRERYDKVVKNVKGFGKGEGKGGGAGGTGVNFYGKTSVIKVVEYC